MLRYRSFSTLNFHHFPEINKFRFGGLRRVNKGILLWRENITFENNFIFIVN